MVGEKSYRLTVYLLKDTLKSLEDAVLEQFRQNRVNLKINKTKSSILIFKDPEPTEPDWFKYLRPTTESDILKPTMTSPSALLVTQVEEQFFALSFGYGRYFLDDSQVVPDFGLKVCLNTLASDEIKTVDKRTLEQLTLLTRQQAVIPVSFNTFDVEVERDLIKSVDGHSDQDFGRYFKGATALTIVTGHSIEKLADLCGELYGLYRKTKYKNEFGWIDNVKYVADEEVVRHLNIQLLKKLSKGDVNSIFLGIPEMVDDSKIKHFKFSGFRNKAEYPIFPSIEQYLAFITERDEKVLGQGGEVPEFSPELEDLLQNRVVAYGWENNASRIDQWTVYRCLHADIELGGRSYKLLDGNWYEINSTYLDEIESKIKKIPEFKLDLIAMKVGEKEKEYNERLSKVLKSACLDQDLVQLEGRSKFEFCDVFTSKREIMHIKKYSGAASISHLLYQSHVSGQMFANDSNVRSEIARKETIKKNGFQKLVNPQEFQTTDFKVVYVIAAKKRKELNKLISFFCKISLAHKYKVLKGMGYEVEYKVVEFVA